MKIREKEEHLTLYIVTNYKIVMYANIQKLFFFSKLISKNCSRSCRMIYWRGRSKIYCHSVEMAGLLGAVAGARELLLGDGSPTIDNWTFRFNVLVLP